MCGRFTQAYTWRELVALYRLTVPASNLEPRYNVAPTTTIDAITSRERYMSRRVLRRNQKNNSDATQAVHVLQQQVRTYFGEPIEKT